ncbi:MAG TPA: LLM class flavin-dependent oxidoreductase [Candidatus Limnocylindrales bacterium]|nr:LLM class flavin-dependent oxidoreductase [Candidatus Limnocylindrales bacterium]
MTVLGVVFRPQFPPERLRPVAEAADGAGLDELWLWEDCFLESGIASAAAALAWTSRLTVGIGVLPVPVRNVALTAMEVATLVRLFPGRLKIGVGHGVQDWMAQIGAKVCSPVTLLREHLTALRALLRGETVTTSGRYVSLDSVALDWPPTAAPAIYAGAIGPRTLRLSGEAADGTILVAGTTPDRLRAAVSLIDEGRSRAGRTDPHPVAIYLHAAAGADGAQRLSAEMARYGYTSPEQCSAAGPAEQVAAAVRRWAEAGASTVVLQPTDDDPDPEGFVRFVAQEVKPLCDF